LPWEPAALGDYKKDPAYVLARERNKRVVHGTNYGMTPKLMTKLFPEFFPNEIAAREAQERYFRICPALPAWHHQVRTTAHRQGFLENPWKRRHYFWHVFEKRQGKLAIGEDGKRCISFLPQSAAADFMLDHLLALGDSPWVEFLPAIVTTHDSICLAVPEGRVDEAVEFLCTLMSRPIPQMGGLQVGVECKVGPNWADMRVVKKISF
jgi:DNA polymerase I-like protein with 3'-5' exonuclease and polymerase domains